MLERSDRNLTESSVLKGSKLHVESLVDFLPFLEKRERSRHVINSRAALHSISSTRLPLHDIKDLGNKVKINPSSVPSPNGKRKYLSIVTCCVMLAAELRFASSSNWTFVSRGLTAEEEIEVPIELKASPSRDALLS